jgi:PAS domain S-box-containing protein
MESIPVLWITISTVLAAACGIVAGRFLANSRQYQQKLAHSVSKIQQLNTALKESEERFHLVVSGAREGIWEYWNKGENMLYGGDWSHRLGFALDELPTSLEELLHFIIPEDRESVQMVFEDIECAPLRDYLSFEYRIYDKEGHIRHISCEGRVMERTYDGEIERIAGIHRDITELKSLKTNLERARIRMRVFLEHIPGVAFISDVHGNCLAVNNYGKEICGISEFLEGDALDYNAIWPEEVRSAFLAQDAILRKTRQPQNWNVEFTETTAFCGEWLIMRFPLFYENGEFDIGAICLDVTKQKRIEQQVRESEERYRSLVEMSLNGVALHDKNTYRYANPAFLQMLGVQSIQELKNVSPIDSIPPAKRQTFADLWKSILDSEHSIQGLDTHLLGVKQNAVDVLLSMKKVVIANDPAILTVVQDITEIKNQERQEKERQEQLKQADKLIALGTLVAGVAHEINNPNSSITFNASTLKTILTTIAPSLQEFSIPAQSLPGGMNWQEIVQELPQMAEDIEKAAQRIKRITTDLKRYASPVDNPNEFTIISVDEVIQSAVQLLGKTFAHKAPLFQFLPDHSARVWGNFQRLEQVMINLLTNAAEALQQPQSQSILVQTAHTQSDIIITVQDEGCGIPSTLLNQVTNPFFSTKRDTGGTGLGLAVCQSIVAEHSGTLSIQSVHQKGTTVTIHLPKSENLHE